MLRYLGIMAFGVLVTTAAHGEQPDPGAPREGAVVGEASCPGSPRAAVSTEVDAEERAFVAELETFARRRAFTERLVAQRNAELFERAIARQARAAKLQRELAERESARSQRELEDAVALYLKKRELARERAAAETDDRARSPSLPPASPSAP
ncbi:MAG: hypothetical protein K0R38_4395 [Polyangiaceae bacterium]|nr:hypothetical protein [Polyangiaceae bacterium]